MKFLPFFLLVTVFFFLPGIPSMIGAEDITNPDAESTKVIQTTPAPPINVTVKDIPNDKGGAVTISWEKSTDDGGGAKNVAKYEIFRSTQRDAGYEVIGNTVAGATSFSDNAAKNKVSYFYKIRAISPAGVAESLPSASVFAKRQWFNLSRLT
ncbi:MAG TPA: fibronectin type III domain-containing protein, partial [candidate division Zixibacteria bacterium]